MTKVVYNEVGDFIGMNIIKPKADLRYSDYQKLIRRRAWKGFAKDHGVRDLVISLVVPLLVGVVFESIEISLITASIFLYVYAVIFLYYFFRTQVQIYNEQARLLNRFWPELLNLLVYESYQKEAIDQDGNKMKAIILEVYNNHPKLKLKN